MSGTDGDRISWSEAKESPPCWRALGMEKGRLVPRGLGSKPQLCPSLDAQGHEADSLGLHFIICKTGEKDKGQVACTPVWGWINKANGLSSEEH